MLHPQKHLATATKATLKPHFGASKLLMQTSDAVKGTSEAAGRNFSSHMLHKKCFCNNFFTMGASMAKSQDLNQAAGTILGQSTHCLHSLTCTFDTVPSRTTKVMHKKKKYSERPRGFSQKKKTLARRRTSTSILRYLANKLRLWQRPLTSRLEKTALPRTLFFLRGSLRGKCGQKKKEKCWQATCCFDTRNVATWHSLPKKAHTNPPLGSCSPDGLCGRLPVRPLPRLPQIERHPGRGGGGGVVGPCGSGPPSLATGNPGWCLRLWPL